MKKTIFLIILPLLAMLLLASCDAKSGRQQASGTQGEEIPFRYATHISMVQYDGYIKTDFRNPWDTTKILQTYILVDRDSAMPADLPSGTVIRIPLQRSIVYTAAHNSLVEELGAIRSIVGVCDSKYFHNPQVISQVKNGNIKDCGNGMAPNLEKILQLKPDVILLSAFENSNDHNKVGQLGIPIVDCIDYMETSPLARAEWMRFFGILYGKRQSADSLFKEVEKSYLAIQEKGKSTKQKPMVLSEMIYGGSWDVPGALSTVGVMIEDAGGRNPFEDRKKSGSIRLSPEEVLYKAKDADFWLIKYSNSLPPTLSSLKKENPVYAKFKAYGDVNVYGCDVGATPYFEDLAFHPDWILAEYLHLFHPEIEQKDTLHNYFNRLEP